MTAFVFYILVVVTVVAVVFSFVYWLQERKKDRR
jgi:uncharacterized membrane protein YwaF